TLGVDDPYTPQFIVDGSAEVRFNNPQRADQVFQKAVAAPKIPVKIESVTVEPKTPAVVRGRIETGGDSEGRAGDVYVAVALDHAESQVLHGENSGRHLTHVAVIEQLSKIGKLDKGKSFEKDFQVKLKPGVDPANIRIVAFVQEPGPGQVLGAALQKPP